MVEVRSFAPQAVENSHPQKSDEQPRSAEPKPDGTFTAGVRAPLLLLNLHGDRELSQWSQSAAKRVFDCACVLLALPLLLPILLAVAIAVRLTSSGPVLFLQKRMGAHGRTFTILKFRTLIHDQRASYSAVTTADNQPFTPIGQVLRRYKLDELPQVFNVLAGHMSLVGPRPKMPEHVAVDLPCRPGITGAATMAFAHEETLLYRVPKQQLDTYYHKVVLPTKRRLDAEYMACATWLSDLRLIVNSMLRRWDYRFADSLLEQEAFEMESRLRERRSHEAPPAASAIREPAPLRTGTR